MMKLTDNTPYTFQKDKFTSILPLEPLANRPIGEFANEWGNNLLIYPHSFKDCKDKIASRPILKFKRSKWCGNECREIKVETGNIVGFFGLEDIHISIRSRFATEGNEDYFLHYMLQRVLNINIFNLPTFTSSEAVFDFLPYLFPKFLNDAVRQGVYKEYRTYNHNDANVRGPIDISRHIRANIPFNGRVAYRTREFSADNRITRLVRATIEHIRTIKGGRFLLEKDPETRASVSMIINVTPDFRKSEIPRIIKDNLRTVNHPYFTAYTPLKELCLRILRHEQIKYGNEHDEIYGILFDAADLWEEYLATIICPMGFRHPNNRTGHGKIYLSKGTAHPRYPDFYDTEMDGRVIDAKYKLEIDTRDDINQMLMYMYRLQSKYGILIHPVCHSESPAINTYDLHGHGKNQNAKLHIYPFVIPQNLSNYEDFRTQIGKSETTLINYLKSIQ